MRRGYLIGGGDVVIKQSRVGINYRGKSGQTSLLLTFRYAISPAVLRELFRDAKVPRTLNAQAASWKRLATKFACRMASSAVEKPFTDGRWSGAFATHFNIKH